MISKSVVIVWAFLFFFELNPINAQSHNINDCMNPGPNPVVVYDQTLSKGGVIFFTQEQKVRVPEGGYLDDEISCLLVANLDSDSDGGYPTVVEGGVGYKYVNLDLKSQIGKGFSFRVIVYHK